MRVLFIIVALLAGTQFSPAATFQFQIDNQTSADIARFFIRGAKIEGVTRVPSRSKRDVKVTMPDGKCRAEIHLDFAPDNFLDDDKVVNMCEFNGLRIN